MPSKQISLTLALAAVVIAAVLSGVLVSLMSQPCSCPQCPTGQQGTGQTGTTGQPGILIPEFSLEQKDVNLLLIFDSSQSMANEIDGRRKIDLAKEAITNYVTFMKDADIALRAYGHRSTECTDTELLYAFGDPRPQELTAAVAKMEPIGLTPIEYSLRQAVKDLPTTGENVVILVSDGEETCGGDPCKAVRELVAAGSNFKLHTVGFGINAEGKGQLQCMAEAGGGQYFDAQNADQLNDALYTVKQLISTGNTIYLDGVEFSINRVSLMKDRDGVANAVFRYRNTKQTPASFNYKLKLSLLDKDGNVVDSAAQVHTIDFANLVDLGESGLTLSRELVWGFKSVHTPGIYAIKAEFYDSTEKYLAGTLYRTLMLGPQAPSEASDKYPKMDAPLQANVTLGGVGFAMRRIDLNAEMNNIGGMVISSYNGKQTPATYTYWLKTYLVNDKGELVDFSYVVGDISNGGQIDYALSSFSLASDRYIGLKRIHPAGDYTFIVRFYTQGSNVPEKFISKRVRLGQDGVTPLLEPNPKMSFSENSALALGGVDFTYKKITLNEQSSGVENVEIAYQSKGTTPASFDYRVNFYLINDKGELVDFSHGAGPFFTRAPVNSGSENFAIRGNMMVSFYDIVNTPGTYTLVMRFYALNSNVPQGTLTKTVQLGVGAPGEQ